MRTAGVVGLGLMGGSVARDLAAMGWRVLGDDPDTATVEAAEAAGVIHGRVRPVDVDVLVLAAPLSVIPGLIGELVPALPPHAVATDLGSTKRGSVKAAEVAGVDHRFVPAHPMAGDHRRGWAASRTGLFMDATVWICPGTRADEPAVRRVEAFWEGLGGRPRRLDADAHDARVARSSHLPQLVATALAGTLAAEGVGPGDLGPGGRDTTRLAGSDPGLWVDILMDNADEVERALEAFEEQLGWLRQSVRARNQEALAEILRGAATWAAAAVAGAAYDFALAAPTLLSRQGTDPGGP
jgi:prephenate dehydrogenase